MMVVQKFCQLLAQALVAFALMAEHYGALEQNMLQLRRQLAPQLCGGGAENHEIARGNVVADLIRMLAHRDTVGFEPPILGRPAKKNNARKTTRECWFRSVSAPRLPRSPARSSPARGRIRRSRHSRARSPCALRKTAPRRCR